jgi:hypothetical protein
MADTVVDVLREQQDDWLSARSTGQAQIQRASDEAEQDRLRQEADHQASKRQLILAKAAGTFMEERTTSPAKPSHDPLDVDSVLTQNYGIDKVLLAKPMGEHWKTTIRLKKAREEAAQLKAHVAVQVAEDSQWIGVPTWKRALLEGKRRKKEEEDAPRLAAIQAKEAEEARFRSLPPWKQKLLLEKRGGGF